MKRLKPFETLDDAAEILNELRQERGLSAYWRADRFLANAVNGDIDLTVVLPEKFDVDRKNGGKKYLDTPLRPSAPKGTTHFFLHKPELYALNLGGPTELNHIVSISHDGVRSVLHSVTPAMTISVSDLRINSEQLFRYILAEQPPAQAPAAGRVYKKSRTNSLDAPIRMAIELAGSLKTAAVFVKLRELAIKETSPFNGDVQNGILSYTDDNNEVAGLTKASLGKRLKKYSQ